MNKKRILYLISDTGGGHRSAAKAISKALDITTRNNCDYMIDDVFSRCSPLLDKLFKNYSFLTRYMPNLYRGVYYSFKSNIAWKNFVDLSFFAILSGLKKYITKQKPDVLVSIHPLINHYTVAALKLMNLYGKLPFLTIVTDPITIHNAWICPEVTKIIVATEEAKKTAVGFGASPDKIRVIGMPIDPIFAEAKLTKENSRKQLNLSGEEFVVLITGGGEGSGGMMTLVHTLEKCDIPLSLLVVAGRNKVLYNELFLIRSKLKKMKHLFGFTNIMPLLMSAADCIATKAGPGTIAEAFASDLPVILTSFVPGQEEGNVDWVVKNNAGVFARSHDELLNYISGLYNNIELRRNVMRNVEKLKLPNSSLLIAEEIAKYF